MRITIAQLNFTVGAIFENADKIIDAIHHARDHEHADIVIFPELALTGYPLEDLLHRSYLFQLVKQALNKIRQEVSGIDVILGYPEATKVGEFNAAVWMRESNDIITYHKHKLPNYSVFDEVRYFKEGKEAAVVECKGIKFGLSICEDVWYADPTQQAKAAGAQCILVINGSPYSVKKFIERTEVIKARVKESHLPIFYANLVGGQDELIFDGESFVIDQHGELCAKAEPFKEQFLTVEMDQSGNIKPQTIPSRLTREESIYQALILGVRDYTRKNSFPSVIIGLSGGIDSALTLSIAVDALGAENVTALFMPSRYSASISEEDARKQAEILKVEFIELPMDDIFQLMLNHLKPIFGDKKPDTTEENIQARIRGTLLMALSNKFGKLVLSTGNKSEMSVGYATLYGDMVGGFCVLKDVFKTTVYQLAKYRNSLSPVIPERVITRAPSAELAPNQVDQDLLPPYDELDQILRLFIEQDCHIDEIVEQGFELARVTKVVKMILRNEYKRRQSPTGIRITEKAFGRDRRYPITSGYLIRE